jgi:IS5 family transposase
MPPQAAQGFTHVTTRVIDQHLFEDFSLPFGGSLPGDNRWITLAALIAGDERDDDCATTVQRLCNDCATQFCQGFAAPVRPLRLAQGPLIIKAPMGLTEEELVGLMQDNPCLQSFIAPVTNARSADVMRRW